MNLLVAEAEKFYKSLHHNDDYSDLRCVNVEQGRLVNRSIVKGWPNVSRWLNTFNGHGNCFIGRNPRNSTGLVSRVTTFSFDLDAEDYDSREAKLRGASAEQIKNCLLAARELAQIVQGCGVGYSGNGALVYFSLDRLNENELGTIENSLRLLEAEVRRKIELKYKGKVHVDTTYDTARMVKFLGSMSCKGTRRNSRLLALPHRSVNREEIHQIIQAVIGGQSAVSREDGAAPVTRRVGTDERAALSSQTGSTELSSGLIPHGQMHRPLLNFAGACRKRGMDADAIYKQLCVFAEARCAKPITYNRLLQMARSMMKYEPEQVRLDVSEDEQIDDTIHTLKNQFQDYKAQLDKRARAPELPTGFQMLDNVTWGLRRGNIFTVGAYTGCGKSTWCTNVATNLCRSGRKVMYLSTELSYNVIFDKVVALATKTRLDRFERGLTDREKEHIDVAYENEISKWDLVINDNVAPKIESLKKIVEANVPDVLIFDHIQQVGEGSAKRNESISIFLNDLLILARSFNFALLVVSQFKRPLTYLDYQEKKVVSVKAPTLFDFKECAGIENKSRLALLMYDRGDAVDLDKPVMTFEVAKNTFGRTGKIDMVFDKAMGRFYEVPTEV